MISIQDGIKYIGLAAIIYFLVKAFAANKLTNQQIALLVLCIMVIVIFIASQQFVCSNKNRIEGYQVTNTPVTDSVYAGPDSTDETLDTPNEFPNTQCPDDDMEDMKDIMHIDKKIYDQLTANEQKAIDAIRAKYSNEMVYTQTHPFNTIPLGTQLYGYTYLPPENWFRAYERPPVCITDKQCEVCPVAGASTSGLMEFDTTNNLSGPAGIDVRYVKHVLNKNKTNEN